MNRKTQQAFAESRSPKIDLRQLRHAVTAADFGSFRQAADACLIKQSTLSRSIRQLEHCVGVAIFERSSAQADAAIRADLRLGFALPLRQAICAPHYSILSSDSR